MGFFHLAITSSWIRNSTRGLVVLLWSGHRSSDITRFANHGEHAGHVVELLDEDKPLNSAGGYGMLCYRTL